MPIEDFGHTLSTQELTHEQECTSETFCVMLLPIIKDIYLVNFTY